MRIFRSFRLPSRLAPGAACAGLLLALAGCPGVPVQPEPPPSARDRAGKVLLLHFFSDRDAGARGNLLEIREFYKKWAPRGVPTLGIMTRPADEESVRAYAREFYLEFPASPDLENLAAAYRVRETPTSIILDRLGRPRVQIEGRVSREDLERRVLELLGETEEGPVPPP